MIATFQSRICLTKILAALGVISLCRAKFVRLKIYQLYRSRCRDLRGPTATRFSHCIEDTRKRFIYNRTGPPKFMLLRFMGEGSNPLSVTILLCTRFPLFSASSKAKRLFVTYPVELSGFFYILSVSLNFFRIFSF